MTLLKALEQGNRVCVTLINVDDDKQYTIILRHKCDVAVFLDPIVGVLEYLGEPTNEHPFEYFKAIFISDNPLKKEEDEWNVEEEVGQA